MASERWRGRLERGSHRDRLVLMPRNLRSCCENESADWTIFMLKMATGRETWCRRVKASPSWFNPIHVSDLAAVYFLFAVCRDHRRYVEIVNAIPSLRSFVRFVSRAGGAPRHYRDFFLTPRPNLPSDEADPPRNAG